MRWSPEMLHRLCPAAGLCVAAALILAACENEAGVTASGSFPDQKLDKPSAANSGVVLAWRKGSQPTEGRVNEISVGDTVIVRVRNLDGWLIRMLNTNRLSGEPDMSPEQHANYALLRSIIPKESTSAEVLRNLEAAERPVLAANPALSPTPAPSLPATAAPKQVSAKDLREADNAYQALLFTVKRNLFLVLNNSQFHELKAENPDEHAISQASLQANPNDTIHQFEFRLRRRPGDEEAWSKLYDGTKAMHDVRVSLGLKLDGSIFMLDTAVVPQAAQPLQRVRLELFRITWLWSTVAWLLVLLALFIYLGATTPLLRDGDLPMRADGCPQFSLSRLQLAFWTYLVVGAFLVIWLVTDRLDTLNPTVLALLGISSATTFASKLASMVTLEGGHTRMEPARAARRHERVEELRERLAKELTGLTSKAEALERAASHSAAEEADLATIGVRIQRLQDDLEYLGHNRLIRFLIDLLSDNGRVTLHRMQIVIWTIVLGVVFIARVKRELAMPTFSETLLGLMGLSSLTYVALKVPELKKVEADVTAAGRAKPPVNERRPKRVRGFSSPSRATQPAFSARGSRRRGVRCRARGASSAGRDFAPRLPVRRARVLPWRRPAARAASAT